MKSLLISVTLLLALAVFVNAKPHHPLPPHKQAAKEACLKKLDLSEEELHERLDSSEEHKDGGCFLACMFKELDVMNEDGSINKEGAIKDLPPFIPEANRTRIVDACFEQKGDDDCETAELYHTCLRKLKPRPPMSPELEKMYDDCRTKLSLTEEQLHELLSSRKNNPKKNCFNACLGKSVGFINEDGTLNKEAILEKLPPFVNKEDGERVAEECSKEEGADECETAVLLKKCFKKNDIKFDEMYGPYHGGPHSHHRK